MAAFDKQYVIDAQVLINKVNSGCVVVGTPHDDPLVSSVLLDEFIAIELDLAHPTVDKVVDITDLTVKFVYIKSCETVNGDPSPVTVKFAVGDTGFPLTSVIMEGTPSAILLSTIDKNLSIQVWVGGKD